MKLQTGRIALGLAVLGVGVVAFSGGADFTKAQEAAPAAPARQAAAAAPAATAAPAPGNTALPGGKLSGNVAVQLVEVAGGFVDPVHVASPKDGTGRLLVCERPGTIRIVGKDGKVLDEPFYNNVQKDRKTGVEGKGGV